MTHTAHKLCAFHPNGQHMAKACYGFMAKAWLQFVTLVMTTNKNIATDIQHLANYVCVVKQKFETKCNIPAYVLVQTPQKRSHNVEGLGHNYFKF